jgi:hypothetical protein
MTRNCHGIVLRAVLDAKSFSVRTVSTVAFFLGWGINKKICDFKTCAVCDMIFKPLCYHHHHPLHLSPTSALSAQVSGLFSPEETSSKQKKLGSRWLKQRAAGDTNTCC